MKVQKEEEQGKQENKMLARRLQYEQRENEKVPRSLFRFATGEGFKYFCVVPIDDNFARITGATENGVEQPLDASNY